MANEPREFPGAVEGGQERYLIIDTLGEVDQELGRLNSGVVRFIDLKLRHSHSNETLFARVSTRLSPSRNGRYDSTWNIGDGDFQEIDLDGQPIGERYNCNGTITTLNVPFLGEVRVSTIPKG